MTKSKIKPYQTKIIVFILLILAVISITIIYGLASRNSSIKINSVELYATDFGKITGHKTEKFCSYTASKNDKFCSTIPIVKVTYSTTISPVAAGHDWREVASPFDIFARNESGKLVCAIREDSATSNTTITFFVRPIDTPDIACAKV